MTAIQLSSSISGLVRKHVRCSLKECGLRRVPQEQAELAMTKVVGAIAKARPPPVNLLPEEQRAIKSLQEDDRILVLPADKGRATMVMDKAQYDEKMSSLLGDRKTYKKLTKDPTSSIERKMNALLLQLKKKAPSLMTSITGLGHRQV